VIKVEVEDVPLIDRQVNVMYQAIILDFDGTLTKVDVLDYLAQAVGRGSESEHLRQEFQAGLMDAVTCLIKRIELLRGTGISVLKELLGDHLLCPGYDIFQSWLQACHLTILLVSGNICPVVQHYQRQFLARRVFCTEPFIADGRILKVDPDRIGKKLSIVQRYLSGLDIAPHTVIAVGDDLSDIPFFTLSGWSIAFNGKGTIANYADQSVEGDLRDLATFLDSLVSNSAN
jgi:HAD superfamily phosphoserine phosphatase-like hydrolase